MKLLVDMNLSPRWIDHLRQHGFEAVHWSTIGAATARDDEILRWAREHQFVVVTNDLDFSAVLAATSGRTPTVVQVRTQDLLSDATVRIVATALATFDRKSKRARCYRLKKQGPECGCSLCQARKTGPEPPGAPMSGKSSSFRMWSTTAPAGDSVQLDFKAITRGRRNATG